MIDFEINIQGVQTYMSKSQIKNENAKKRFMGVLTQFWSPRGSRFFLLKYERERRSEVPFTIDVITARKFRKNVKISKIDHFLEIG